MSNVCAKELAECILFTKVDYALLVLKEPVGNSQRQLLSPWNAKRRLHRGTISVSVECENNDNFFVDNLRSKSYTEEVFPSVLGALWRVNTLPIGCRYCYILHRWIHCGLVFSDEFASIGLFCH